MIVTPRLILRPIEHDDLTIMRGWFSDPSTMGLWGISHPISADNQFEEDLHGRFRDFDRAGYLAIVLHDSKLIGRIEFEDLDEIDRSCEVMIVIGEPAIRGHGYGSEAMVGLLGYLFGARSLHRVSLTVRASNHAAIRSYESAGFVKEGVLRGDLRIDGRRHDQFVMSILARDYWRQWGSGNSSAST